VIVRRTQGGSPAFALRRGLFSDGVTSIELIDLTSAYHRGGAAGRQDPRGTRPPPPPSPGPPLGPAAVSFSSRGGGPARPPPGGRGLVASQGDAGAVGLDALLAGSPEELPDDAGEPGAGPPRPEVFKAGRWDRARGNGAGFASGGVADDLPPGPTLAGLTGH